jgi:hypothetical protein
LITSLLSGTVFDGYLKSVRFWTVSRRVFA